MTEVLAGIYAVDDNLISTYDGWRQALPEDEYESNPENLSLHRANRKSKLERYYASFDATKAKEV